MADITFSVLDNQTAIGVNGSGLGFFGANYGNSVPTTEYQRSTYVTDGLGGNPRGAARNTRFLGDFNQGDNNPTGIHCSIDSQTGVLLRTNSKAATLRINFNHSTSVNVQNCQLRIYDRTNIDYPATGVVTKVAEIVNFSGIAHGGTDGWINQPGNDFVSTLGYASGDAFWWGAPWPSGSVYGTNKTVRPRYVNSVGVSFYNFTDYNAFTQGSGNPDIRLATSNVGQFTVGGTGLIVPLLNSPGPSGSGLTAIANTATLVPKYAQYVNEAYQTTLGVATTYNASGDPLVTPSTNHTLSWGGSGAHTNHMWFVALSARPLTIGAKSSYALYISLEYL